jgi:hypothetical protein
MISLEEQLKRIRRAGVPLVVIETEDQPDTVRKILTVMTSRKGLSVMQWDKSRAIMGLNEAGIDMAGSICEGKPALIVTGNPSEMLRRIYKCKKAIVIMHNAHRFINNEDVGQGIANLREQYKELNSLFIMLCPSISIPIEMKHDILTIKDRLPTLEEVGSIAKDICDGVGMTAMDDMNKISDTLIGLSAFEAEQTLSTSIYETTPAVEGEKGIIEIDREALWDRKCIAIEQTPGLRISRGKETICGYDNVRNFIKKIMDGKNPPRLVLLIDEIEKLLAGIGGDSSGVSQDQLGITLTTMQENEYDGMIFYGVQGSGKTAVSKEIADYGRVPLAMFDLGAMKGKYVGTSEGMIRGAWNTVGAMGQGRVLVIATCNNITILPPELRRRFTLGTFFFDTPSAAARNMMWEVYEKKYSVNGERPMDEEWTGAEIKICCKIAAKLECSLLEASKYIVPVAISAKEQIDLLRGQASGKFIDASRPGVYQVGRPEAPMRKTVGKRNLNLKDIES